MWWLAAKTHAARARLYKVHEKYSSIANAIVMCVVCLLVVFFVGCLFVADDPMPRIALLNNIICTSNVTSRLGVLR